MKIKFKKPIFKDSTERDKWATVLSSMLGGDTEFKVYKPNGYYWAIDPNNDWKVSFDMEDASICNIRYRYARGDGLCKEKLFCAWVMSVFGAEEIK